MSNYNYSSDARIIASTWSQANRICNRISKYVKQIERFSNLYLIVFQPVMINYYFCLSDKADVRAVEYRHALLGA